jgi:CxxC-x17-CxxC domain-containing protein
MTDRNVAQCLLINVPPDGRFSVPGGRETTTVGDLDRTCRNCGTVFPFTEGEQAFYLERGYQPPAYCPDCRDARRAFAAPRDLASGGPSRPMFDAICSSCGEETRVPFQPRPDRPVYCDDCFTRRRLMR